MGRLRFKGCGRLFAFEANEQTSEFIFAGDGFALRSIACVLVGAP